MWRRLGHVFLALMVGGSVANAEGNKIYITQSGSGANKTTVRQQGGQTMIQQTGDENTVVQTQSGFNNTSVVKQTGKTNVSLQNQQGEENLAITAQTGETNMVIHQQPENDDNRVTVKITGGTKVTINQTGKP